MKRLWAVAMFAEKGTRYFVVSCVIEAQNEDEARGKALRICKTAQFPASDGYYAHGISIVLIPDGAPEPPSNG